MVAIDRLCSRATEITASIDRLTEVLKVNTADLAPEISSIKGYIEDVETAVNSVSETVRNH